MPTVTIGTTGKEQVAPLEGQFRRMVRILTAEVVDVATEVNLALAIGTPQAKKTLHFVICTVVDDLAALKPLERTAELFFTALSLFGKTIPVVMWVFPVSEAGWSSFG
jgi:hypothetical protein